MGSLMNITGRKPVVKSFENKSQLRAGANIVKFMAVLIVLTIIARGASGATLAMVSVVNPSRGEITQMISGNALVSSMDTLDVYAPEGLTIQEMIAVSGQTYKPGDALVRFDLHEINMKLTRENAALEKMLLDIEALERDEAVDSNNLNNNQRYLTRAQEDYDSTKKQGEADVAAAQAALNEAQAALNDALNAQAEAARGEAAQAEAARSETVNRSDQTVENQSASNSVSDTDHIATGDPEHTAASKPDLYAMIETGPYIPEKPDFDSIIA